MTSSISTKPEARASVAGWEELLDDSLPALYAGRPFRAQTRHTLHDGTGRAVCDLALVPRVLQVRMLERAAAVASSLRAIPEDEWLGIFHRAGRRILDDLDGPAGEAGSRLADVAARASKVSGLPVTRLLRSWRSLASNLEEIEVVLRSQAPAGRLAAFHDGKSGAPWRWLPSGRNAAVRIPGNFPTINITWLQVLATRRPVLLGAPLEDPFTPLLLALTLIACGLPEGALSLVHGEAPVLWQTADQVIWPGDLPPELARRGAAVRSYHQGRSKVVLTPGSRPVELWPRLARMAVQGCGRLCTNLSSLVVAGERDEARAAGLDLARAFGEYPVLGLEHPNAIVPAFAHRERGLEVASRVGAALRRGAVDLSEEAGLGPLEIERDGALHLRPTVLLVDAGDPLFGAELPFPFVTVIAVAEPEVPRLCRGSLIVGVVGESARLVEELVLEPSIDKVFSGEHFDHGYRPEEPHEGFLADFLFHKKTVLLDGARATVPGEGA